MITFIHLIKLHRLLILFLILFFCFSIFIFYEKYFLKPFLLKEYKFISTSTDKNFSSTSTQIKILFAGDVMLNRYVKLSVKNNFKNNYLALTERILTYLKNFDFIVINLEGPVALLGYKVGSIYSFRMEPKVLPYIKASGINIVNLANNHIFDYSREAFTETLDNLLKNKIYFYGVGKKEYDPLIIEKNNIKIGFLGYSDFLKNLSPQNDKVGVYIINDNICQQIKKAKKQVDILFVTFHWGEEYQKIANERQREIARLSIDCGADMVIGYHPHVVQNIEKYKDKFIFYSLGNFIFDQNFSFETMRGGLVEVLINGPRIENVYFRYSYLNDKFQVEKISDQLLPYSLKNKIYLLKEARTPAEWQRGLMFVKKDKNQGQVIDFDGMIFIFPDKQIRSFWNKNTFLDLKLYWLEDDKIIGENYLPSIEKSKEEVIINSPGKANKVIEIIR